MNDKNNFTGIEKFPCLLRAEAFGDSVIIIIAAAAIIRVKQVT